MALCQQIGEAKANAANTMDIEDLVKGATPYRKITETPLLQEMIREIISRNLKTEAELKGFIGETIDDYKKRGEHHDRTQLNNINLLFVYRMMSSGPKKEFEYDEGMEELFRTKKMRSLSGVLVFASFTHPFSDMSAGLQGCKYDCWFCPLPIVTNPETGEVRKYPRSYPPKGPATQRADRNDFDTLGQFMDRMTQYLIMGHRLDKVELIVLGGTWHSYPLEYRRQYIRDNFWAANNFYQILRAMNEGTELPPKKSMEEEIADNRTTDAIHIIGVTIETRPDQLTVRSILELRDMAVTRIQIGIQHTDDEVLRRVNRGSTNRHNTIAIMLAMLLCMKVDIHIMPDMVAPLTKEGQKRIKTEIDSLQKKGPHDPEWREMVMEILKTVGPDEIDNSRPMIERDRESLQFLIDHRWGDEWKLYPMEVVDFTPLPDWYEAGIHKSYFDEIDFSATTPQEWEKMTAKKKRKYRQTHNAGYYLLKEFLPKVPATSRVTRLMRDIPLTNIRGGNDAINGRQYVEDDLKKEGVFVQEMRAREVRNRDLDPLLATMRLRPYWVWGEEPEFSSFQIFIEFSDSETEGLYSFLRLGFRPDIIPAMFQKQADKHAPELIGCGYIRELHTYGQMKKVGSEAGNSQHLRFGTRSIQAAEYICHHYFGLQKMAVVSGAGVEQYYTDYGRRYFEEYKSRSISGLEEKIWTEEDYAPFGYHRDRHYMIKHFPEPPEISEALLEMIKPQLPTVWATVNPLDGSNPFPKELLGPEFREDEEVNETIRTEDMIKTKTLTDPEHDLNWTVDERIDYYFPPQRQMFLALLTLVVIFSFWFWQRFISDLDGGPEL